MSDDNPNAPPPLTPSLMLSRLTTRLTTNLSNTFANFRTTDYIRLIAVLGGYLLLRPYLQKLGAKLQERDHARAIDENEEDSMAATGAKARIIAGEGHDLESDDEDNNDAGDGWGQKQRARKRLEKARKKKEIEDRIKAEEDEEDKDIQEFLHD
ncbi:hypothetical protein TWF694_009803 [Orbilia ellipsospora]|uniref:DUF1531-domain-containing protein n=1 Tax=Orbilia ellipsospora TaxID=2528407 RepID=A0AAV9XEN5_9PEZI